MCLAAEVRVVNTLIGTVVGIAFSLLVPVSIPSARATGAVNAADLSRWVGALDVIEPNAAPRALYDRHFDLYRSLYQDTRQVVHQL